MALPGRSTSSSGSPNAPLSKSVAQLHIGSAGERTGDLIHDRELFREACYIGGRWLPASGSGAGTIAVDDPASGAVIGEVPNFGRAETRQAIDAAADALPEWRARTGKERAAILRRWFELLMSNQDELARLMTLEQGKPLGGIPGRGGVRRRVSRMVRRGSQARLPGDTIPSHARDKRLFVVQGTPSAWWDASRRGISRSR